MKTPEEIYADGLKVNGTEEDFQKSLYQSQKPKCKKGCCSCCRVNSQDYQYINVLLYG